MIELNGNTYALCLLDTNAASEMAKNPTRELRHYLEWSLGGQPMIVPCFSLFTIMELRRNTAVYEQFLEAFSPLPCVVLKSHEQLLEEEVAAYPDFSGINPILHAFLGLAGSPDQRLDAVVNNLFSNTWAREKEQSWLDGRDDVIAGVTSLVSNYPPEDNKYTESEIRTFLEIVVFEQLALRFMSFAKSRVDAGNAIRIDAFPSLKMSLFTVFYKFYVDNRRPSRSDAFDIIISAPTPYVDAIITERHQAEVLRKIKQRDAFVRNVTPYILKDFRLPLMRTGA